MLDNAFLVERVDVLGYSGIAVDFLGMALITLGEGGGFGISAGVPLLVSVSATY